MKFLILSLGKIIFQMGILIFIIGYCFGFWFKSKNKPAHKFKLKSAQAVDKLASDPHDSGAEAA